MPDPPPVPAAAELAAELERLLAVEHEAITDEPIRKQLLRMYEAAGGSRVNLRTILVDAALLRAIAKLETTDLPGPDELWRPYILAAVKNTVTELLDDLYAGRNLASY